MNPYGPPKPEQAEFRSRWRWLLLLAPPVVFVGMVGLANVAQVLGLYLLVPLVLLAAFAVGIATSIEVAKDLGRNSMLLRVLISGTECLIISLPFAFILYAIGRMVP